MKRTDGFTYAETIVGILILSLLLFSLFPLLRESQIKAVELWQRSRENAQIFRLIHRLENDLALIQWKPWKPGKRIRSIGSESYSIQDSSDEEPDYNITVLEDEIMIKNGERISRYTIPTLEFFSVEKGDFPSAYNLEIKTTYINLKTTLTLGSCVIGHAE